MTKKCSMPCKRPVSRARRNNFLFPKYQKAGVRELTPVLCRLRFRQAVKGYSLCYANWDRFHPVVVLTQSAEDVPSSTQRTSPSSPSAGSGDEVCRSRRIPPPARFNEGCSAVPEGMRFSRPPITPLKLVPKMQAPSKSPSKALASL